MDGGGAKRGAVDALDTVDTVDTVLAAAPTPTLGVRRLAVVMFTDMVDSTMQRQRLGDRLADEIAASLDSVQSDLVATHGGVVVKSLGDGAMAAFTSVTSALACAAGIQSELRLVSARLPEPVQLRIGLSAGEVAEASGDLFGMSVVEAARLCAAAPPDTILVADVVRRLIGNDTDADLSSPRPMRLKGLDDEVVAWELGWSREAAAREYPSGLRPDQRFGFVGRERELTMLAELWKRSQAGDAHLAVVSGDAGVGKTRLVSELALKVHADGGVVLHGRNDEGLDIPYQPFAEALRQYVATQPAWALRRRLGHLRGELVRLLPELATITSDLPPPVESDPDTERRRLFDAVGSWLAEASTFAPLLLVIEDVHWASAPTRQLLRHVTSTATPMSLLVVATQRPEVGIGGPAGDPAGGAPWAPHAHRLALDVFDVGTVLDFLEAAAGHPLEPIGESLAQLIHTHSGGNAFFCRELALHLVDNGVLTQVDGRWSAAVALDTVGVPDTVRRVVEQRVARLPELARQVLLWSAIMGREVDVSLLTDVLDGSEDEVLDALDLCVGVRLLEETGPDRFTFHHALVRSSLADSIGTTRRRRMHRRVADALLAARDRGDRVAIGELARHFALGARDTDADQAVALYREAAQQAEHQLAYEQAVEFLERTLALLDRAPDTPATRAERADASARLAADALRAGDPRAPEMFTSALRAAEASGDPRRVGAALVASSRGASTVTGTVDTERVHRLEEVLDRLPTTDDPLRARLLALLATELQFTGEVDRLLEIADQALAMARRLGDHPTRIFVLAERLAAIRLPEHLDAQLADVVELRRLSREEGDLQAEFFASYRAVEIHLAAGDLDAFDEAVDNTHRLALQLNQPALTIRASRAIVERHWLRGELDAAAAELERMWAMAHDANLEMQYVAGVMGSQAKIASARGDADVAVGNYRRLTALPRGIDGFWAGLAVALALRGELDEARSLYGRLLAKGVDRVGRDITRVQVVAYLASLCTTFGDAAHAREILVALEPYRRLYVSSGANSYGAAVQFMGPLHALLGEIDAAEECFREADERTAGMGAPLHRAFNRIEWARAVTARGETDRARALLESALADVAGRGALAIERQATELLRGLEGPEQGGRTSPTGR